MNDPQDECDARIADLLDAARARVNDVETQSIPAPENFSDLLDLVEDLDAAVRDWKSLDGAPVRPDAEQAAVAPESVLGGRYTIVGEIGRGGMGVVYRATDVDLQRPLAVKVLAATRSASGVDEQRFLEEARITGQLQHPGIAPVHEVGRLADGRPFFAMKLIAGRTLADMLRARPTLQTDLPRFLAIFEQIAQTMAYAHAQGVIHRDLKPANVMVGAFGEVQVMDWGLAKRLQSPETHEAFDETQKRAVDPVFETTAIYPPASAITKTGTVLGTPAFMPPEQARGEIAALDRRGDVFGLGGILCVILTGQPPYVNKPSLALESLAPNVNLDAAHARLSACGADGQLIALAKECLATRPDDRPCDAGVVAARISGFLASVQERLRAADIQRAADQARAVEERKRRRILFAVGVAAVVVAAGIGIAIVRQNQVKAEVQARRTQSLTETLKQGIQTRDRLHVQLAKKGGVLDQLNRPLEWKGQVEAVRAAVARATSLRDESETPIAADLEKQLEWLASRIPGDEADRSLVLWLDQIRQDRATWRQGGFDLKRARNDYAEAFMAAGLDVQQNTAERLAGVIRQSQVKEQLVAALDDWALLTWGNDDQLQKRLLELARLVEPGKWSDRLRDPAIWDDGPALALLMQQIAREAKILAELSPALLHVVSSVGMNRGKHAENLLRRAQLLHPNDFHLSLALGTVLSRTDPAESAGYFRTALAIRPNNTAAWNNLGAALHLQKRLDEAVTAYRKAVEFGPRHDFARTNLADVFVEQGKLTEAFAVYNESLAVNPSDSETWRRLGILLDQQQKLPDAENAFRQAATLQKDSANAWSDLGAVLDKQQKLDDAIAAYRQAVKNDRRQPNIWYNLGLALTRQRKFDEAAAAYQKVVELAPQDVEAWYELGAAFVGQKKPAEAAVALKKAVLVQPKFAGAHLTLGQVLLQLGQFAEAGDALRRFLQLATQDDRDRSLAQQQFEICQRYLALDKKLPAILRGDIQPKDVAEQLALAKLCGHYQKRYAAAVRFYEDAFAVDGTLQDALAGARYASACAAAQAGAGQGVDAGQLDDGPRTELRQKALAWLRSEFAAYDNFRMSGKTAERKRAKSLVDHLSVDTDLIWVREPDALAKLPAAEQTAWRQFWADVEKLRSNFNSQE